MPRARGSSPATEFVSGRVEKEVVDAFYGMLADLHLKPGRALGQALRLWMAEYGIKADGGGLGGRDDSDPLRPQTENGIRELLERCGFTRDRALSAARVYASAERKAYLLLTARATSGKDELKVWTEEEKRMLREMGHKEGFPVALPASLPDPTPNPLQEDRKGGRGSEEEEDDW